jgi:hypothetical protein
VPETSQVLESMPALIASHVATVPSTTPPAAIEHGEIPPEPTNHISEHKSDPNANHTGADSTAIAVRTVPVSVRAIQVSPIPGAPAADAAASEEAVVEPPPRMSPLAITVDVLVGIILLVIGGLLGEVLAQKSTGDVFWDASASVRFPPIDLMLWLAPPTLLLLIHGLLISRRKSAGAWVQRRKDRRVT